MVAMKRIALLGAALALAMALSASIVAQPWEQEAQLGTLNEACQQGNLAACVKFGFLIGNDRAGRRPEWLQQHPECFWWENQ